jgi:Spy/CpxP family protein refolding chaperone
MLRKMLAVGLIVGTIGTVAVAAAPGTGAAPGKRLLADTPLGRMVSGCIGRLLVLRADLNLTDQQKQQVRDVLVSHRAEIAATVKTVHEKRVALRTAVLSGTSDEAAIRAKANELGGVIGDAAVKAAKLRGELAPILTAEQRQLVQKFLGEQDAAVSKFLEQASSEK